MARADLSAEITPREMGSVLINTMSQEAVLKNALEITRRLSEVYHASEHDPGLARRMPAVDELVLTLLSQNTSDVNSWRGYEALCAHFADWDAVADASLEEVIAVIRRCGMAQQKAPRIQALLQRLRAEHGRITLDFLKEQSPSSAMDYLTSFHGVGRKTASCVMLFALDMPALPVDTHVLRVAKRLALIPQQCSADEAHDLLETLLPSSLYLEFHVNLIMHGRKICTARTPHCARCVLVDVCPTGREVLSAVQTGNK